MIKNILCEVVERRSKDNEVAVLLSGGVDSLSVAFAASDVGKKIHAYSFHLDTHISYDFQKAKEVSEIFGWKFTGVIIPTKNLISDFKKLSQLGCKKKTAYECTYPFLYVYPEIEQTEVLSGWAADGYYGISKKAMMHYRHTQELFDEFREDYFRPDKCANYPWHKAVSMQHDKKLIVPYLDQSVKAFFYMHTWEQLNKPSEKHHVRNAFEQFKLIGNVKKHLNLQINSGIIELFESLIDNNEINFRNRTRVMDICRDWYVLNSTPTLEEFLR